MERFSYWFFVVFCLCVLVVWTGEKWADGSTTWQRFLFTAHVEATDSHTHFDHHDPRFSADQTFPPQPANIAQIESLETESRRSATLPSPPLAQLPLGEQFVKIGSQPWQHKHATAAPQTISTYYSYSHNTTVLVQHEAETVITTTVKSAEIYQPPLLTQEVAVAVELARKALATRGVAQHDKLVGFAILALPTDGDDPYFPTRIAYVTFHKHVDGRPLWTAYVDLSQMQVVDIAEG